MRDPDHLVVGFLSYQDFAKGYKDVTSDQPGAKPEIFYKFKKLIQNHFEGLVFAELHWKKDVIHKIEDLVIPDENSVPMQRSEEEGVIKTIRARNIYYMKCRGTVDEYISRMLYRKDRALWESLEHLQLA